MHLYPLPIYALLLLVLAGPAPATDGVLEINQTCAKQTGCFVGDTAGFPVTITGDAGRSYKLTSDIGGVIGLNTNAIEVSGDDITINLAGFRILCTTFTPPFTVDPCSDSGGGTGIGITADDVGLRSGVKVSNGSIVGMPASGVLLGSQSVVRNLRVSQCGFIGIHVGLGSIVSGSTSAANGDKGIVALANSTVSYNTVSESGFFGIEAGAGTAVLGNTVYMSAGSGIVTFGAATVSNNTTYDNAGNGISAASGSTISRNTAHSNGVDGINAGLYSTVLGNTAYDNTGDGINTSSGCNVQSNTVGSNGGWGLDLTLTPPAPAYRENVINDNTMGSVDGGVNMGNNSCDGTSSCP